MGGGGSHTFRLVCDIGGGIMKMRGWPRPPMVVGFVIGPIFERYLFLSQQIYGTSWMLRPVVIGIALIIAWVLYRPLSQTAKTLWHEFKHLDRAHIRIGPGALFTLFGMAVATAALIT